MSFAMCVVQTQGYYYIVVFFVFVSFIFGSGYIFNVAKRLFALVDVFP